MRGRRGPAGKGRWPRGRALPIAALLALGAGCSPPDEGREPVSVDLSEWAGAARPRGEVARASLELAPGASLELHVRLPSEAELRVEVEPEPEPGGLVVTVASDSDAAELGLRRAADGDWRAALGSFAPGAVRLRFENRAARALVLESARVVGRAGRTAPLPASVRPPAPPVNVLLYVIDTARADRLAAYGGANRVAPNLDALADRSSVFVDAYAPAPSTGPSLTAIFSGLHPSRLGARLRDDGPARITLAEAFRASGWATRGFQANFLMIGPLGYRRGFDRYTTPMVREDGRRRPVSAGELHANVLDWLRAGPREPFFLFVQSMDVHEYEPPEPFSSRFLPEGVPASWEGLRGTQRLMSGDLPRLQALYDATFAYADHELAALLDALRELGLAERTAVMVTSDHGEPLGQHDHIFHGTTLYEELVRIPMILYLPWDRQPRRVGSFASLMDVAPTLLDLAGAEVPDGLEGRSLLRPAPEHERAVGARNPFEFVNKSYVPEEWYLRRGPWKLRMDADGIELFHLPSDPGETRDVSDAHAIEAATLAAELVLASPTFAAEWQRPPAFEKGLDAETREETEEALRALGYTQ